MEVCGGDQPGSWSRSRSSRGISLLYLLEDRFIMWGNVST